MLSGTGTVAKALRPVWEEVNEVAGSGPGIMWGSGLQGIAAREGECSDVLLLRGFLKAEFSETCTT